MGRRVYWLRGSGIGIGDEVEVFAQAAIAHSWGTTKDLKNRR
ncbi:MAG: hypothetical protein WB810_02645 [Candidatus Cybelea sp.]